MRTQMAPSLGPEGPRKIVAAHLSAWSGLAYDWRSQVAITSGSDSLAAVLDALVQPGEEVVTILPSDAALRRRWHRRTRAVILPSLAAGAPVWSRIAIACLRADAWLVLDARGVSSGHPDGSHPAALPGMARRTITVGSMAAGQLGWIVGPKRVMAAVVQPHQAPVPLPAA